MDTQPPTIAQQPEVVRLSSGATPVVRTVLSALLLTFMAGSWVFLLGPDSNEFSTLDLWGLGLTQIPVMVVAWHILRLKRVYVLGELVICVGVFGLLVFSRSSVQRVWRLHGMGINIVRVVFAPKDRRRKVVWFLESVPFLKRMPESGKLLQPQDSQ
jgi:hypothetical protein